MKQSRQFWKEGHLCDVVVKSRDGIQHRAHALVLSAAGRFLKNLLAGPFLEADQVRQGKPVEIAASEAVSSSGSMSPNASAPPAALCRLC